MQPLRLTLLAISAAASALVPLGTRADPVTINTPFLNLENRGINSIGFSTGQYLRIARSQ